MNCTRIVSWYVMRCITWHTMWNKFLRLSWFWRCIRLVLDRTAAWSLRASVTLPVDFLSSEDGREDVVTFLKNKGEVRSQTWSDRACKLTPGPYPVWSWITRMIQYQTGCRALVNWFGPPHLIKRCEWSKRGPYLSCLCASTCKCGDEERWWNADHRRGWWGDWGRNTREL